jgi:hypothetical protein
MFLRCFSSGNRRGSSGAARGVKPNDETAAAAINIKATRAILIIPPSNRQKEKCRRQL